PSGTQTCWPGPRTRSTHSKPRGQLGMSGLQMSEQANSPSVSGRHRPSEPHCSCTTQLSHVSTSSMGGPASRPASVVPLSTRTEPESGAGAGAPSIEPSTPGMRLLPLVHPLVASAAKNSKPLRFIHDLRAGGECTVFAHSVTPNGACPDGRPCGPALPGLATHVLRPFDPRRRASMQGRGCIDVGYCLVVRLVLSMAACLSRVRLTGGSFP